MWPPELAELKNDLGDEYTVADRDDARLQRCLDAAVSFVERVHAGCYAFGHDSSELPDVDHDMHLGVLRLAGRWFIRRRSPDALIQMGELGAGRIPSFDPDIDRMLRIGRHAPMRFA